MQLQRPSFIQEQRLKMSPQLYQSIKLMEMPIADLREKIEEELERNPALELVEDHTMVSLDEAAAPRKKQEEEDYFEASSDSGFVQRGGGEESADEHRRFIEGALSRPETLQDHLLWQLQLEPIDEELKAVCETLIQNLDADGFHKEPVDLLFKKEPAPPIPPARLADAMELVQSLEPQGTCTSDYRESLRVQIGLMPDIPDGIEEILDYLEPLERGKFAETAKKLSRTEDEVRLFFERIRELSPFPGRQFASDETRYVIPDVQVIRKEGEFVIIINDEEIPVLGINSFFTKLASPAGAKAALPAVLPEGEKPARDFVRENIREARWFIQSVKHRNDTLKRVSEAVVRSQRAFFDNGPKYLAPLTLREIAEQLDVHETTVSRTANGKYMQTEWGIFEIRHFFTNSISIAGSERSKYSKEGVKEIIREIISVEQQNLSDQKIVELLAQRGIPLARRTVAKYRGELDLGSSYAR